MSWGIICKQKKMISKCLALDSKASTTHISEMNNIVMPLVNLSFSID